MDASRVRRVREDKERAEAGRLQAAGPCRGPVHLGGLEMCARTWARAFAGACVDR